MQWKNGMKPSDVFTLKVSSGSASGNWTYACMNAPFGSLFVAGEAPEVSYIAFYETEEDAVALCKQRQKGITLNKGNKGFEALALLLQGQKIKEKISLSIHGTPFQQKVWDALLNIPFGTHFCYGEIADRIGHPNAYRAVGTAVGRNPIAYFIPCHRVLAANGGIGGYYWGTAIKRRLLAWEGIEI